MEHQRQSGQRWRGGAQLRDVTLDRCTLTLNKAADRGGAVFNAAGAGFPKLCVTNSTLTANVAGGTGGALHNDGGSGLRGVLAMSHATVAGNEAGGEGGGLFNAGAMKLRNSIVADNESATDDADFLNAGPDATFATRGGNVIGNNANVASEFPAGAPNANGDVVGTPTAPIDPRLSELGAHGGPTLTLRPIAGSPAIDTGTGSIYPSATSADSGRSSGAPRTAARSNWSA